MYGKSSLLQNWSVSIATSSFLISSILVQGLPPAWWESGESPVLVPGASEKRNDKGPANIGQAKWMAYRALATVRMYSPELADQIEGDLVGSGKPIPTWVAPVDPEGLQQQHSPLLIGQLKAISAPFYSRINAVIPTWLANERDLNDTETGDGIFPWTATNTADDNNKGIATIGQLKAVFGLHFTESNDDDSISDFYEWIHYGGTGGTPPTGDADGDGRLDVSEIQEGGDLSRKDHPAVKLNVTVFGD